MRENHGILKGKKILMTGATGFLGSHLLPALIDKGLDIIALKRSTSDTWRIRDVISQIKSYDIDKVDVKRIFDENNIEGIIHLATDYGRENDSNIKKMTKIIIELPTILLDLGSKYEIRFFLNTHTFCNSSYMLYCAMKRAFIEIAKFYANNFEIKLINMKLEHMYGEKDNHTKFIPFVIKNILNKQKIMLTKGRQKRDFIYVQDVVNAYLKVLDNSENIDNEFMEFEIGTGDSISLRDFVNKIEEEISKKGKIEWGAIPYKKNEIFDSKANIEKAKNILGWHPNYDISNGLKRTINWYKKSMNK